MVHSDQKENADHEDRAVVKQPAVATLSASPARAKKLKMYKAQSDEEDHAEPKRNQ